MAKFTSVCVLLCATFFGSSEAFSPVMIAKTTTTTTTAVRTALDSTATTTTTDVDIAAPAPVVEEAPLAPVAAVAPPAPKKTFPVSHWSVSPSQEKRPYIVGLDAIRDQQKELGVHCECFGDTSRQVNTEFTTLCG